MRELDFRVEEAGHCRFHHVSGVQGYDYSIQHASGLACCSSTVCAQRGVLCCCGVHVGLGGRLLGSVFVALYALCAA